MIDQDVASRNFGPKLGDSCAARRNRDRLNVGHWRGCHRSKWVGPVENFPDDVEAGSLVGSANAKEDANAIADIGLERLLRQGLRRAVEDVIFGLFREQLVD